MKVASSRSGWLDAGSTRSYPNSRVCRALQRPNPHLPHIRPDPTHPHHPTRYPHPNHPSTTEQSDQSSRPSQSFNQSQLIPLSYPLQSEQPIRVGANHYNRHVPYNPEPKDRGLIVPIGLIVGVDSRIIGVLVIGYWPVSCNMRGGLSGVVVKV